MVSVGEGEVTERDITDWQAAQACYGPDAITSRKAGFMRNFEATILEVLLARAKRPLAAAVYDAEAARIDRETRAADILACVKKYFGGDGPRYRRVFLRPILAQRGLRDYVKSDPGVQAKAFALRDGALKGIAAGKTFAAIGAELGIAYSTSVYSLVADTAAAAGTWPRWSPFEEAFIDAYLMGLKPGEARPAPIEDEAGLRLVRLTAVTGKKYYFETLYVPKLTTEEYLKSVKKLPCRINDRELHDWVVPIKGNPLIAPAEIAP